MKDTPENRLKRDIKLAQREIPGLRLFSNPRGTAKQGATMVSYGLAAGSKDVASSDFVGWRTRVITVDMVGQKIAQFVSVEAKALSNKPTPAQSRWLDMVNAAYGVGDVIYSTEQLKELFG